MNVLSLKSQPSQFPSRVLEGLRGDDLVIQLPDYALLAAPDAPQQLQQCNEGAYCSNDWNHFTRQARYNANAIGNVEGAADNELKIVV